MSRFRFRLETMLRIAVNHRDEMRDELSQAQHAMEILQQQGQQIEQLVQHVKTQQRDALKPGEVQVDNILHTQRYEFLLRAQVAQLQKQQQQVSEEIQRRRDQLVEADRQVRMLEKLKEKQWNQFRQAEAQQEIKQLDEMARQNLYLFGERRKS